MSISVQPAEGQGRLNTRKFPGEIHRTNSACTTLAGTCEQTPGSERGVSLPALNIAGQSVQVMLHSSRVYYLLHELPLKTSVVCLPLIHAHGLVIALLISI